MVTCTGLDGRTAQLLCVVPGFCLTSSDAVKDSTRALCGLSFELHEMLSNIRFKSCMAVVRSYRVGLGKPAGLKWEEVVKLAGHHVSLAHAPAGTAPSNANNCYPELPLPLT